MPEDMPNIAVINSNEDIIEGFQLLLTEQGYPNVSGHVVSFKRGRENFIQFLKEHNPSVIIFDIAPPYDQNWNFFQIIRNLKEVENREFILTTTNKSKLEELIGKKTSAMEIMGKPFDMKEVIKAVNEAAEKANSKRK